MPFGFSYFNAIATAFSSETLYVVQQVSLLAIKPTSYILKNWHTFKNVLNVPLLVLASETQGKMESSLKISNLDFIFWVGPNKDPNMVNTS